MKKLHISRAQHAKTLLHFLPPKLSVDAVIIQSGKILFLRRDIPPYRGYWVFPGGHVESDEHPDRTVVREVREEVGVRVRVKILLGAFQTIDPRGYTVALAYLCEIVSGVPRSASWESCGLQWFPLSRLPKRIGFGHRQYIPQAIRAHRSSLKKGKAP